MKLVFRLACVVCVVASGATFAHARPKVPRPVLKEYFQSGDRPTQGQFSMTSLDGEVSSMEPPDFSFTRGLGSVHLFEGLFGAAMVSDGSGHALPLGEGATVGPASPQFQTFIDSSLNLVDDRKFLGLRFLRGGLTYYGYLDVTIHSPLPASPGYYGFTIHGWAYEDLPNTPIVTSFVPAPSAGCIALSLAGLAMCRRRRNPSA